MQQKNSTVFCEVCLAFYPKTIHILPEQRIFLYSKESIMHKTLRILSKNAFLFIGVCIVMQIIIRSVFFQDHLFFHAEQERDFTLVRDAWINRELMTLGPVQANTGNFHLGPLYYYLLLPFLLVFRFHPIAGEVMMTIFWIAAWTIAFIYLYKRHNPITAYFFSLLLLFSEIFFVFTTIPLNTGVLFFFEAIFLITLIEWLQTKRPRYIYICSIAFASLLQLHLSSFSLFLMIALILLLYYRTFLSKHTLFAALIIPLLYIPFFVYEFRSHFYQTTKFFRILTGNIPQQEIASIGHTVSTNPLLNSLQAWIASSLISHRWLPLYEFQWFRIVAVILLCAAFVIGCLYIYRYVKNRNIFSSREHVLKWAQEHISFMVIFTFSLSIFIGTIFIDTALPRHYLLILFVPLLLLAICFSLLWQQGKWGKVFTIILGSGFVAMNIYNFFLDFQYPPKVAINHPYESFSDFFPEQNEVAKKIATYMRQHTNKQFLLRTSEESKDLRNVTMYLINWHSNFHANFVPKGKNHEADKVIYLTYNSQLPKFTPIFSTQDMNVYVISYEQWKRLKF